MDSYETGEVNGLAIPIENVQERDSNMGGEGSKFVINDLVR